MYQKYQKTYAVEFFLYRLDLLVQKLLKFSFYSDCKKGHCFTELLLVRTIVEEQQKKADGVSDENNDNGYKGKVDAL